MEENKNEYTCYGHFYETKYLDNAEKCRSVLEIINNNAKPINPNDLLEYKPNAIFIMMNPGKSRPKSDKDNFKTVDANKINEMKVELVEAWRDPTLWQLVRVMENKKWTHLRVINLSDIRNPDSGSFMDTLSELEENKCTIHSCFDEKRRAELVRKMNIATPNMQRGVAMKVLIN